MRKLLLVAVVVAAALPAAAAAGTEPFDMQIKGEWGGASAFRPCPLPELPTVCETGHIRGYGKVAQTFRGDTVREDECYRTEGISVTYLLDRSGTLTIFESLLDCTPGSSGAAPGNRFHSFGNPFMSEGTFTIVGGTGVFEGASGRGTQTVVAAGDTIVIAYSGELVLPR